MILKAEYLFRPGQLLRRTFTSAHQAKNQSVAARLPWGRCINISPQDSIGQAVLGLGVYDLVVTETLWRLTDLNDTAVDVGANVGCMTAALGERAAEVHAFEPHPMIFAELSRNLEGLKAQGVAARLVGHAIALGSESGVLPLHAPADFRRHRGESTLAGANPAGTAVQVPVSTVDEAFPERSIGIMKLDVEGFELRLLEEGRLRDCIFEEHRAYPTDVTFLLEKHGFAIFRLARRLTRPELLRADSPEPRSRWEATSFLATRNPDRAFQRLSRRGWSCLAAKR
jgi:FkbM family methyltransferase